MSRRVRLNKEIGKEYVKNHRGPGALDSVQIAIDDVRRDQLKAGSMIISDGAIMTTEEYEHRAWLARITQNVNRRLGHR